MIRIRKFKYHIPNVNRPFRIDHQICRAVAVIGHWVVYRVMYTI